MIRNQPKQANRLRRDRTTPAVRPMRPSMGWTPQPKHYGKRQKIRLAVPVLMMLKKRRYLIGLVERRKSE